MTFKDYFIAFLILLVLLLGFGTYYFFTLSRDQDQPALRENAEQEIKLRDANTRIVLRDSAVARLQSEMDSAARYHSKTQTHLRTSLNASKRRERLTRKDTFTLTLVDTVYMAYDSLLEDLTLERDEIRRDCKTLVDSLLANAMDFRGIIDIKDLQNTALQKEVTKEKKRGRIFKWLFYAAAAGLIFESVKD